MSKSLIPVIALALVLSACGVATIPCGTFMFSGKSNGPGVGLYQSFLFGPALCKTACATKTIAYIQVVRITDVETGEFLYASADQQARTVTGQGAQMNGWAVDRLDGFKWGYFGRNDDGTFLPTVEPGNSNGVPAIFTDDPSVSQTNVLFEAIDVPICIDPESKCVNEELGYDYWLFLVDASNTATIPHDEIGRDWQADAVDLAVAAWNTQAPALLKNAFPAFTRLN